MLVGSHSLFVLVALSALGACAVTITAAILITARDVRRALAHLQRITIPRCDRALQETACAATQARQLLKQTHAATHQVTTVIGKTCHTASDILEQLVVAKDKAQRFLVSRFGNHHRKS